LSWQNPASNPGNAHECSALRHFVRLSALAGLALLPLAGWASDWQVSVDEQNGLPTVTRGGPGDEGQVRFLGANWSWTGFLYRLKVNGPYHYTLLGKNKELDFDLQADIRKEQAQTLSWAFDLDAHSRQTGDGWRHGVPVRPGTNRRRHGRPATAARQSRLVMGQG
jgi:hypothetical protein